MKYHYLNRDRIKEKEDKDKWTNAKSASVLISYLCQCVDQSIIDFVFDLIQNYLMNDDSKIKESVILAFGSISETIYPTRIKDILEGALPSLLNLLEDKSIDVRSATAWSLRKISQHHTDKLIQISQTNPDLLDLFFATLFKNMNSNRRVVMNILDTINKIAVKSKLFMELTSSDNVLKSSILSKYYSDLLNQLILIPFKKDAYDSENNVALMAFYTINSLVENTPIDCIDILSSFFPIIITSLQATQQPESCSTKEQMHNYQEALCSLISVYLIEEIISLTNDQINYLFNLVKGYFLERGTIFESGIVLCSRLIIIAFHNNFNYFEEMLSSFTEFLFFAIESWEEANVCFIAIGTISEFIENLDTMFNKYLKKILPIIISIGEVFLNCLKNRIQKQIKV
jgi:hypothetical protein